MRGPNIDPTNGRDLILRTPAKRIPPEFVEVEAAIPDPPANQGANKTPEFCVEPLGRLYFFLNPELKPIFGIFPTVTTWTPKVCQIMAQSH